MTVDHAPADIIERLREVDPEKLLRYLSSVLPIDEPDLEIRFTIDGKRWLDECTAFLLAETRSH